MSVTKILRKARKNKVRAKQNTQRIKLLNNVSIQNPKPTLSKEEKEKADAAFYKEQSKKPDQSATATTNIEIMEQPEVQVEDVNATATDASTEAVPEEKSNENQEVVKEDKPEVTG